MGVLIDYQMAEGVRAFSTTRTSPFGLSAEQAKALGPYAAFNITHYCGDDAERVKRNREWLCQELGVGNECLLLPRQTHGDRVLCVDNAFCAANAEGREALLDNTDALLTNLPGLCIGVSTADCVPVLLYDERQRAVAAIHAGWRGTASRIVEKALRQMTLCYGTRPADVLAVIGPSISAENFEVGEEVADRFKEAGFPAAIVCRPPVPQGAAPQKPHIDLWAANAWLLEEGGVPLQRIRISGICTYAQHDTFFSARRLGIRSGRIFTGICLQKS